MTNNNRGRTSLRDEMHDKLRYSRENSAKRNEVLRAEVDKSASRAEVRSHVSARFQSLLVWVMVIFFVLVMGFMAFN